MSSTDMSILASTEELYELNTCSAIGTLLLSCQNPSLCLASVAMSMGGGRKEQLGGDYGFLTPCPTHGTGQISSESQAAGRNPPRDCPFIPCIISTQYLAHILGSRVCQFSAPSWGAFPLWDVAQTRGRTPFCSLAFKTRLVFNRICMCIVVCLFVCFFLEAWGASNDLFQLCEGYIPGTVASKKVELQEEQNEIVKRTLSTSLSCWKVHLSQHGCSLGHLMGDTVCAI